MPLLSSPTAAGRPPVVSGPTRTPGRRLGDVPVVRGVRTWPQESHGLRCRADGCSRRITRLLDRVPAADLVPAVAPADAAPAPGGRGPVER